MLELDACVYIVEYEQHGKDRAEYGTQLLNYPDLVFYNRILHCGVIIELKNEEFSYENFGQLNAYVSRYRENEMHPGDNPPIGILLCTRKGKKMVEYALAGMDNQLFVSTYMLQLPDKKTLEDFLLKQLREQES